KRTPAFRLVSLRLRPSLMSKKSCRAAWDRPDTLPERGALMAAVDELSPFLGVAAACEALGVPRATYYRALSPKIAHPACVAETNKPRKRAPRALSDAEREHILTLVNSERFADLSPREIYATLLDEGVYVCSWPTIYRLLREQGQTTRRRE